VASKALQSEDLTGPFTRLSADWRPMSSRQVLHSRNGSDCSGDTVTPDVSEPCQETVTRLSAIISARNATTACSHSAEPISSYSVSNASRT